MRSIRILVAVLLSLTGVAAFAQSRVSARDVARLRELADVRAAVEALTEDGETVNFDTGQLFRGTGERAATSYAFDVYVTGTRQPGTFAKLVIAETPGQPTLVYFEGDCTFDRRPEQAQKTAPPPPQALSFCFKPWSNWTTTKIFCGYNYWCFFKGQKAMYASQTRSRQCPNGVQVQNRTVKMYCGC